MGDTTSLDYGSYNQCRDRIQPLSGNLYGLLQESMPHQYASRGRGSKTVEQKKAVGFRVEGLGSTKYVSTLLGSVCRLKMRITCGITWHIGAVSYVCILSPGRI